jgi:hypothetical protein
MRVLVVYESMFGNTRSVAAAVARGLSPGPDDEGTVTVREVGTAPTTLPADLDLLVVGAPTHAFSLSRASTRRDAETRGEGQELVSTGIGIREWIEALDVRSPVELATFDTKVRKPRLPGSAAKVARRQLRSRGLHPVAPPATFYVSGVTGPLLDGEAERAERWGAELAERASRRATAGRRAS